MQEMHTQACSIKGNSQIKKANKRDLLKGYDHFVSQLNVLKIIQETELSTQYFLKITIRNANVKLLALMMINRNQTIKSIKG